MLAFKRKALGRTSFLRLGLLCALFLWIPSMSFSQEYYFNNFSGKDGLAQSQVYALLEDDRGYIWMGTWGGGLSQFDGQNFINHSRKEGLLSNYIYSLEKDQAQNIWIGTDKGLCQFDGQSFQYFLDKGRMQIYTIEAGSNDRLWIGTQRGLYVLKEGVVKSYPFKNKDLKRAEIRTCYEDSHGFLWMGSSKGIFVLSPGGNVRHFGILKGWNGATPFEILEDGEGTIWIGTEGGGIQWSDGSKVWTAYTDANGLSSNRIVHLHRASTGEMWAGTTEAGLNIWSPVDSSFTYLQEKDGLESNDIRSVIEDSWGNHWVGTSGGGVSKYSGQQFVLYDEADGLVDKEIYGICEDTLGQLWLSTSQGISRFDGRNFQHYGAALNWPSSKSRTVLSDEQGQIWAGFDNKGLGLYAADTFRLFTQEEGIGAGLIRSLAVDSLGWIWVGSTIGGITQVIPNPMDSLGSGYIFRSYNRTTDFPANYIYALLYDREGRMWFATRYLGLGYFDEQGDPILFDQRHGLPDGEVRTLAMDSLGNCWAGTARGGVFRFALEEKDSLQVWRLGEEGNLSSNNIYQLAFDAENYLWIGHEKGVDRVQLNNALDIAEVKPFGYSEGFKGGETCNSAVICDRKGDMWFGTMNGLTHYRAGSGRKNTVAPKIHLAEIRLFYQALSKTQYAEWAEPWGGLSDGLLLPHRQNSLGFFFKGINQSNPGKVMYEWQLEGYEEEWSPRSENNSVNYSNLPPGDYVFKVRAYNEDLVTNLEPVVARFSIDPPFWQRWWFRLAMIALAILIISVFFRTRLNQVRKKAKEDRERLEMEKHLVQLEQKALQLQMNPHFIFNALNSIQGQINQSDHKKAKYQLAKFSKLMRATLENSRESTISLSDEIQSLENYLALEQFSRNQSFEYEVKLAEGLDPEALAIPPMMIQPFVENAIIHGVAHVSDRKGKIELQFQRSGRALQCLIVDNGIGRKAAALLKSQQDEQHKSAALQVTRERLELLGDGDQERLQIIDLWTDDGLAAGTKVLLLIPVFDDFDPNEI